MRSSASPMSPSNKLRNKRPNRRIGIGWRIWDRWLWRGKGVWIGRQGIGVWFWIGFPSHVCVSLEVWI
jgi:hypothetical protein